LQGTTGKAKQILLLALCIIIAGIVCIYHFVTYTPYGRIDFSSALILRLVNLTGDERSAFDYQPEEFRKMMDDIILRSQGKLVSIAQVEDMTVPWSDREIPVRIYRPLPKDNLPVILFLHGGGYVSGSLETHENFSRKLANQTSSVVISIGYSLAPEAKFPTPVEEGYAVLQWIEQNAARLRIDPGKIIVAGDSAGGTTATALSMKARDLNGPALALQVLFYPATNVSNFDTPSHKKFGKGYFLTQESMEWTKSLYLRSEKDAKHPYASPLLADSLTGMPPTLLFTAQFDPLSSEGAEYAQKLTEAGNDCRLIQVKGVLHGFASTSSPKAKKAFQLISQKISAL
jgi:acetyl esterase